MTKRKQPKSEWISAPEAAEILDCTARHVWYLWKSGYIEAMRVGRRAVIYRRLSVEMLGPRKSGPVPKISK